MSVPRKLAAVANDPRFWASYLWEDEHELRFSGCKFALAVSSDASLIVEIIRGIDAVRLLLPDEAELAVDAPASGCPDVLRWSELEVVCRALALRHPELAHPGLPLRLLARFAPVCTGDDMAAIAPVLMAAWHDAGASERVARARLERADRRADGLVWRSERGRWLLEQRLPEGRAAVGMANSTRANDNTEFPHDELAAVIAAAQATVEGAIEAEWRNGPPGELARAAVQKGDLAAGDEIAGLLAQAGCRSAGLLRALTDAPAARAWALEVLLAEPAGRLVAHFLGHEVPPLRPRARLTLELPAAVSIGPVVDRLSNALRAADLGQATIGGSHFSIGPGGVPVVHASFVPISIRGDIEEAIALIRETLPPALAGAVLRVDAPTPRDVPL